jgi:hypothetical protein
MSADVARTALQSNDWDTRARALRAVGRLAQSGAGQRDDKLRHRPQHPGRVPLHDLDRRLVSAGAVLASALAAMKYG